MDPVDLQSSIIHGKSAINWLLELCQKEVLAPPVFQIKDIREGPTGEPKFETVCTVKEFNGRTLVATEQARTKKDAKQRSAISMLNAMGMSEAGLLQMKTKPDNAKIARVEPMMVNQKVIENPIIPDHSHYQSTSTSGVSATGSVLSGSDGPASTRKTSEENGHSSGQIAVEISSGQNAEVPAVPPSGTTVALSENNVFNGASESLTNGNGSVVPIQATPTVPAEVQVETTRVVIGRNHKMTLHTFCTRVGIPFPEYKVIAKSGPPHAPIFTMRCTITTCANHTHIVEASKKTSQKDLGQMLALEMLEKLSTDVPALRLEAKQMKLELASGDDKAADQYRKGVPNTPGSGFSSGSGRDFEAFAHRHHVMQNRLREQTMLSVKKVLASEGGIFQTNPIAVMADVCREYERNGCPIKTSYKVYPSDAQYTCILEFGNSTTQKYACYGMGVYPGMAEMEAARAALEFLYDMSLKE